MEEVIRIPREELEFDPEFMSFMQAQSKEKLLEAEREVEYDVKVSELEVEKMRKFFFEELSCETFAVGKLQKQKLVYSLKLKKITSFMTEELEKICKIIEQDQPQSMDNIQILEEENERKNLKTKKLLEILNRIKQKYQENKNQNYYQLLKNMVKEECRQKTTIDEMREFKRLVSEQIK